VGDRGIFGIEAASRKYYGKSASELGPEESARLASVLPNPRRFNPLGSQRYVIHRSNLIYNIMVRRGIVVPEFEEVSETGESAEQQTMTLLNRRCRNHQDRRNKAISIEPDPDNSQSLVFNRSVSGIFRRRKSNDFSKNHKMLLFISTWGAVMWYS